MSSKDYQVVKRMRKVQLNPQTSGDNLFNLEENFHFGVLIYQVKQ